MARWRNRFDATDAAIHRWLVKYSLALLRISVGLIFFSFGLLKLFPGVSPAESIVRATTDKLTLGHLSGTVALVATGAVEVVIGAMFISGQRMRAAAWLLAVQLLGVLSPLVVLAPRLFDGPHHAPTLEGQYVLKDLIIAAAAMVVASTVRGGRLVRGPQSAKPTDIASNEEPFSAAEKLTIVLDAIRHDRSVADVCSEHVIDEADFRRWRDEMLDGAEQAMAVAGEGPKSHI